MSRQRSIRVLARSMLLLLAISATPAAALTDAPPVWLEDKKLIDIPTDHLQPVKLDGKPAPGGYAIFVAANRSTAAYIARKDDKHFVVVGSEKGPDLEGEITGLRLPADGKTVIYVLRTADHTRTAYVNHKPIGDGASVKTVALRDLLLFSPDGSRVAAVMQQGQKDFVILDGVKGPEFEGNPIYVPVFSPDSKHFTYHVNQGGKCRVVLDGKPGPEFRGVERPVFSSDSAHMAYAAAAPFNPDKPRYGGTADWHLVVDGVPGPQFDGVNTPTFGPDNTSLAYVATVDKKNFIVFNGKQGTPFDVIYGGDGIFISPDSKRIAYKAKLDAKTVVVVDDQISPPFEFASEFRFSPDSKRFAYKARVGDVLKGKELLIDNGERSTEFDKIGPGSIVFSPDSATLACSATAGGKSFIVLNGKKGPEYEGLVYNPVYSPDGSKLAYSVNIQKPGESRGFVVVNGEPGPEFDGVSSPVFSPDSRHFAYGVAKAGKQFIAIDHKPGPECGTAQSASFTPDSRKVTYQAINGREVWWKVLDVPQ